MCLIFIALGTEKILLIILFLKFNQLLDLSGERLLNQKIMRPCYLEGTLYHSL